MFTANTSLPRPARLLTPTLLAAALMLGALPSAEAGCNTACAFRAVTKPVKQAGNKGINFASETGRQLASMSENEFNTVKSGTNAVVRETQTQVAAGYTQAITALSNIDELLLYALRSNANKFLSDNEGDVRKIVTTADKLSDQARAALKRISQALPSKQVTSSMKADMQLIATEMGFADAFKSMVNSSWGLGINGDIGVGPVGANTGMAIVLDVKPDSKGVINGAIVSSIGASAGIDIGAGGSLSIFWQPGLAKESTGLGVGFGMSAESRYGGGGIGFSWPISVSPSDYAGVMAFVKNRIATMVPGITVSVDIPGAVITEYKASADINAGWSQVITPFAIDGGDLCTFVTSTLASGLTQTKAKGDKSCPGASSDSR